MPLNMIIKRAICNRCTCESQMKALGGVAAAVRFDLDIPVAPLLNQDRSPLRGGMLVAILRAQTASTENSN